MRRTSKIAVLFLFSIFRIVHGNHVSGKIDSDQNWVLVSRFSFADDVGRLDIEVKYSATSKCCPSLAYYNDESWESVNKNSNIACQSKISYAQGMFSFQNATGNNNSTDRSYSVQCYTHNDESHLRFCSGTLRLHSVDGRWWSFVLSHCNSTQGLNISYEFKFTDGSFWNVNTWTTEQHIFEGHLISFGGFLVLVMISLYFARQLRRRGMLHPAFKFFMASLGFKAGAMLFDFIYYVLFQVGLPTLMTGEMFHATSEIVLIVLLVLLAFGWTITKARLNESMQTKLNMFFSSYILVFGILFVLEQRLFGLEDLQIAGIGNAVLRAVAWVLFAFAAFTTIQQNPAKQPFFLLFMSFYSAWFLAKPFAFLAAFFLEEWQSAMIYHRLDPLLCFLGFGGLLYIMRPKRTTVNFPFHARNNEVNPSPEQNSLPILNVMTEWSERSQTYETGPTY